MDGEERRRQLQELWNNYRDKKDVSILKTYAREFQDFYGILIDVDFVQLNQGLSLPDPEFSDLPDILLTQLSDLLEGCVRKCTERVDMEVLKEAEIILRAVIIIVKDKGHLPVAASCEFVRQTITLSNIVLSTLSRENAEKVSDLLSYVKHTLYFLECLYDPYFVWRKSLAGWKIDTTHITQQPIFLHVEVIPFFYDCLMPSECFQQTEMVDVEIQTRLFHVFGAVISGSKTNALKAICPATLDVLQKVLCRGISGSGTVNDQLQLQSLVLQCLVKMVHRIHEASADQRQIEVGFILEGFFQVILNMEHGSHNRPLQLKMFSSTLEMLNCSNKHQLQHIFVAEGAFETFVTFLHKMTLTGIEAQTLAMSVISVVKATMAGSQNAKDHFKEKIGYSRFVLGLKRLGQPSMELLNTVLDMVIEGPYKTGGSDPICNAQAALMLIHWLPDINANELQLWLTDCLRKLCQGNHNLMQSCNEGMIRAILDVLTRHETIIPGAVDNLIHLLEALGTMSITSSELTHFIKLLKSGDNKKQHAYCVKLMHAMSKMARKDGRDGALQNFDLSADDAVGHWGVKNYFNFSNEESGIFTYPQGTGKWPGSGFCFSIWLCLDEVASITDGERVVRRQLYSFLTTSGSGFEAFFTPSGVLTIAVVMKKEYVTLAVDEYPITDNHWHCISISHSASKRPFQSSQLTVFIDSQKRLSSNLKFPTLTEPMEELKVGSPGMRTSAPLHPLETLSPIAPVESNTKSRLSLMGNISTLIKTAIPNKSSNPSCAVSMATGYQDAQFGSVVSILGQVGSACLFHDALSDEQMKAINAAGPNSYGLFLTDEMSDLQSKLIFHYNAKASLNGHCQDLSPRELHATLYGTTNMTWDIKDIINSLGGIQVLFPLLEQMNEKCPQSPDQQPPWLEAQSPSGQSVASDETAEWVVVPSSSYADAKLMENQVAGFLTLLRNMMLHSEINQETLVRENAVATLGLLLQKLTPGLVDVHVLMAVQLMIEAIAVTNKLLLHHIYQYILMDFRIWCQSEFTVRIGHIQYLNTLIKEDKNFFRKKYGVQFMLDTILKYYRSPEVSGLSAEDNKTIRGSFFSLVKFYMFKEVNYSELASLLNFISAVDEEALVTEALLLLHGQLLSASAGRRDQIYLLMYEPEMGELLYVLLTKHHFSMELKQLVLKIIATLLDTDKVSEKNKIQLKLAERGMYQGLMGLIAGAEISATMLNYMMEQVINSDSEASVNAVLSILQLLSNADLDIKLAASNKVMKALFTKHTSPKLFAKQLSWQEIIVRLLIIPDQDLQTPVIRGRSISFADVPSKVNTNATHQQIVEIIPPVAKTSKSQETYSSPRPAPPLNNNTSKSAPKMTLSLKLESDGPSTSDDGLLQTPDGAATPQWLKYEQFTDPDYEEQGENEEAPKNCHVGRRGSRSADGLTPTPHGVIDPSCSVVRVEDNLLKSKTSMDDLDMESLHNKSLNRLENFRVKQTDDTFAENASMKEEELQEVLSRMGVKLQQKMEKTEELVQNLLIILFTIMWKGVEGCDEVSWKQRGQVFAAISYNDSVYELLKPKVNLNRRLIELMLQGCIQDLKETGQTNQVNLKNAMRLIKHVYNFVCLEQGTSALKHSERIIEDVMTLLDLMTVWESESGFIEMEQFGISILLQYAAQGDINLVSIAGARLHTLLQTRPIEKLQESCFVIYSIDNILTTSIKANEDQYNYLIPVMKALVDKCYNMLDMAHHCPHLPTSHRSPTFFDDFREFCLSDEWRAFMTKMILPSKNQYESNIYDRVRVSMKSFIGDCHEDMMVDLHRRYREKGESKLKFQDQIGDTYKQKARQEVKRYKKWCNQLKNQHSAALRQWRSAKQFFIGERGVWGDVYAQREEAHWKQSNLENFSRMRPKLIYNFMFDKHEDASRLRDNEVIEEAVAGLPVIPAVPVKEDIGDDRLGDEEWNIISTASIEKDSTSSVAAAAKEKLVLAEDCELITVMDIFKGRLEVTTTHVYFFDGTSPREEGNEDFKWSLAQLREIHFRRYNLRRSALEMFLVDQTNYFLNFQKKTRNRVYSRILSLRPPNLIYYGSRSPAELLKASGLTQKWVQREISNFDYLMQLNTIAGRTYNDLSQYPVFPWILSDYTSENLDLDDPKMFRDLSKPIGVINPKIEDEVREKYENFEDPSGVVAKFHYGTHYSNAASVMHYLVRMEPYTTLHIRLQSGRFDVADRQFHSIPASWTSLYNNPNDVKELIPEFFYLPEFLVNMNGFDLGTLQQNHERVNDVQLPKWASSPEDFINKHMKALECDLVSSNLHNWIDLIFGYKQKGQAAVDALNVFYYCTYEGAVDLDAITDPMERKAIEGMINNFGQTPCQLLKEPHPQRMSTEEAVNKAGKVDKPLSLFMFLDRLKTYYVEASNEDHPLAFICVPRNQMRSFIQAGMPDSMIAISETGILGLHGWLPYDKNIANYFTFEKDTSLTQSSSKSQKKLAGPFAPGLKVTPKLFAVTHDAKIIFSGGLWDNSIRVYSATKGKTIQNIVRHSDVVTCVSLDHGGQHLITGSRDTTCMVWQVSQHSGVSSGLNPRPIQILYGHQQEVTCVALSVELDLAVSGSKDGSVIIHTVRKGAYIRALYPPCERLLSLSVELLCISDVGQICVYCRQTSSNVNKEDLHVYSINGKHLCTETVQQPISHMMIANRYLLTGSSSNRGLLVLKELFGLRTLAAKPLQSPITCISITNQNSHVLVGLRDGKLIIVGIERKPSMK